MSRQDTPPPGYATVTLRWPAKQEDGNCCHYVVDARKAKRWARDLERRFPDARAEVSP